MSVLVFLFCYLLFLVFSSREPFVSCCTPRSAAPTRTRSSSPMSVAKRTHVRAHTGQLGSGRTGTRTVSTETRHSEVVHARIDVPVSGPLLTRRKFILCANVCCCMFVSPGDEADEHRGHHRPGSEEPVRRRASAYEQTHTQIQTRTAAPAARVDEQRRTGHNETTSNKFFLFFSVSTLASALFSLLRNCYCSCARQARRHLPDRRAVGLPRLRAAYRHGQGHQGQDSQHTRTSHTCTRTHGAQCARPLYVGSARLRPCSFPFRVCTGADRRHCH